MRLDMLPGAFLETLEKLKSGMAAEAASMLPFVGLIDELAQDQKHLMT